MKEVSLCVMSRKGYAVLRELIERGCAGQIDKVVIAHDKAMANDYYNEMYTVCKDANVSVYDRTEKTSIASPYCITVAWRWMIPLQEGTKLIVFHDSILPKYRGFSPLVNMLINKEPYIGVSSLYASNEYDKGDIIAQRKTKVDYPIKISDAIDLISPLFTDIIIEIFDKLKNNQPILSNPQNEAEASYSLWRDEEDYHIDWGASADYIQQFVYSVGFPFKGAYTLLEGEILRVLDCEPVDDVFVENRMPGKMIFHDDGCPVVVCGKGLLKLTEIRDDEGNNRLPLKKFRNRFK